MLEEMFKSDREVEKENGLKKGDFMFELKDKKLVKKIKKGKQQAFKKLIKKYVELEKQKYGKYFKALKDCQLNHCKHERNTLKKTLKADKKNIMAKTLYKTLQQ